ncbi:hypothetical protein KCM76_22610 [Zooshikella marina]|uniref:hypothetical protein n=1 Tax=Zooshikella ganghwensis TaxID=202772 RepID=UPI001BAE7BBD|nr:hypothetical protein [Zooshikella ganghwensis]MBU2708803.1 hypothetical protein [Zooshikella ganghwensis]
MSTSTWSNQPVDDKWNTVSNWQPKEVPMTKAIFSESSTTTITFSPSRSVSVSSIEFDSLASTIPSLTITGEGVVNHSTSHQHFIITCSTESYQEPQLKFKNSASAGIHSIIYEVGPANKGGYGGGGISFSDSSSADTASFIIYGTIGSDGDTFGNVVFHNDATAANATFNNICFYPVTHSCRRDTLVVKGPETMRRKQRLSFTWMQFNSEAVVKMDPNI